jgi:hypothetical protein
LKEEGFRRRKRKSEFFSLSLFLSRAGEENPTFEKKIKTFPSSLTGLIAAIIVARPAAFARFAMISLPSMRA